jgi:hypothetical protein
MKGKDEMGTVESGSEIFLRADPYWPAIRQPSPWSRHPFFILLVAILLNSVGALIMLCIYIST